MPEVVFPGEGEQILQLKSGAGLGKAIAIPSDFYLIIPFMVQLVVAPEVYIEGEVYVDGELFVA